MKEFRWAMGVAGVVLVLAGVAVAVASGSVDLTPSVCPFCGVSHSPVPEWKYDVRADVGLTISAVGFVLSFAASGET